MIKNILLASVILMTYSYKEKKEAIYLASNSNLKEVVIYPQISIKRATTYIPYEKSHTSKDGSHLTMAGGKQINPENCAHKYIAISEDLKSELPFGTIVLIKGAGKYSGEYEVADLLGKHARHQIDILINQRDYKNQSFKNVKVVLLEKGSGEYFKKV